MRRLTAILCLTLAVLLGSAGVSWSADLQEGAHAYHSGDYEIALREWKPLAEQGNAYAQYNLGTLYDEGEGVVQFRNNSGVYWIQDNIYAHMWYSIAASSGHKSAGKNRDIVAGRMT